MRYTIDLTSVTEKNIYDIENQFCGVSPWGDELSFTNYYMKKNGKPFFGISGEFHFSRMHEARWEDELLKVKMGGINTVSTYVIWNHHEEKQGELDFTGRRNLRRFVELCSKHGLYVILRVGPFAHGEARNGGLPDWLYGQSFEVRSLDVEFLQYVRGYYHAIGEQVRGLFFQEDGPIIGVQIDNEYMHCGAPWEMTRDTKLEWVNAGKDGDAYMLALQDMAAECGLKPVFYTCTGWGGASTPQTMMPLWGGYAFRPWLFYGEAGVHPATDEYIYQDFHNNQVECNYDFHPAYDPETRPYACCEMGGGMMCSERYRFQFDYKSVDALANIKLGSGGNFLGYYMYHGGTNPLGREGNFLNEGQLGKLSYDYQAPIGEYGQVRESYHRLRVLHYFLQAFGDRLCPLKTVLPKGASHIDPEDMKPLRYAVRTDGKRGFLFVNNYQDHVTLQDRKRETVCLQLPGEEIAMTFDLEAGENGIFPFHFDMDGIELIWASAQPVTRLMMNGEIVYIFMIPAGMRSNTADFVFEDGVEVSSVEREQAWKRFTARKGDKQVTVIFVSRRTAKSLFLSEEMGFFFAGGTYIEDEKGLRNEWRGKEAISCSWTGEDGTYTIEFPELPYSKRVKEWILCIEYEGDRGEAYIDGQMVHDNLYNGTIWEIGMNDFKDQLKESSMEIRIIPMAADAAVNLEFEGGEAVRGQAPILRDLRLEPVYEFVSE